MAESKEDLNCGCVAVFVGLLLIELFFELVLGWGILEILLGKPRPIWQEMD